MELRHESARGIVVVRDTGVGIAPEFLANLFQPFAQADRTLDRRAGGLGLGLSIARGFIQLHGGELRAASSGLGSGAEFAFSLPVEVGPARALPPPSPSPSLAKPKTRRVLVIEDNPDAAESLRDALELDEHQVAVAFSGPEGLVKAHASVPDIVLCDIGLPGMDGYAVAGAFRSDKALHHVPLVALTGYASVEDQEKAVAAGFDQHLAKPPELRDIERILAGLP